jgi:hypothetical protein
MQGLLTMVAIKDKIATAKLQIIGGLSGSSNIKLDATLSEHEKLPTQRL